VPRETYERAVYMNVRGMNESERCHLLPPMYLAALEVPH
jgi:hypothetical protein